MIIFNILYIIILIITIFAVIKKQKGAAIFGIIFMSLFMISSHIIRDVNDNYRESAWNKLMQMITKEIKNGNANEIQSGIDKIHDDYSKFHTKQSFMGNQYRKEIEQKIQKTNKSNLDN
jgi:hypothetical protein